MISGIIKISTRTEQDLENILSTVRKYNKEKRGISFLVIKKEEKIALNSWMIILDNSSPLIKTWGAYKLKQILEFVDSSWGPEFNLYIAFFANKIENIYKFIEELKNKKIQPKIELRE